MTVKNKFRTINTNQVGDSGSTEHFINIKDHIYNTRHPNDDIVVVDGNSMKVDIVGDIDILVKHR